MEISNNIPLPVKKSTIFGKMKIGDSIVYLDGRASYEASRMAMKRAMKETGFKFTMRLVEAENSYRIWRTA